MFPPQMTYPSTYAAYYPYDSLAYLQHYSHNYAVTPLHQAGRVPRDYDRMICGPRPSYGKNHRHVAQMGGRIRPTAVRAQTEYPIRRHGDMMYGDDYEDYYFPRRRRLGPRYRDIVGSELY